MRMHQSSLGVGAFVPAKFEIPQNPFTMHDGYGMAGMGEFVKARWTIPQNPFLIVKRDLATQGALAGLGCGDDCHCGGGCGHGGMGGLSDYIPDFGSVNIAGTTIPITYLVAGGVVLAFVMLGSGRGSNRSAYKSELSKLRSRYPTRAGRARRALSSY